jgi:hypothetical protein
MRKISRRFRRQLEGRKLFEVAPLPLQIFGKCVLNAQVCHKNTIKFFRAFGLLGGGVHTRDTNPNFLPTLVSILKILT